MSRRTISILAAALLLIGVGVAVFNIFRGRPEQGPGKEVVDPVASVPYRAPLTILVQATYPGANAQTVAETVAVPIEEQVNGVEHMLFMSSQSSGDGGYRLQITFEAGTDLDVAQIMVQNRISQALPVLPVVIQQEGILVRKRSPEPLLLIALTAPGGRHDDFYLGNYAAIQVRDELARVPGVGDVTLTGERDLRVRVTLDPDKLAARQLTATDVITALGGQNLTVTGLPVGPTRLTQDRPFAMTVTSPGRTVDPEQLESVILRTSPTGQIVRLRDVARVELGRDDKGGSNATLNASPAVVLSIYPLPNASPGQVSRAVADKVAELRARLPDGLALTVVFDFAPNMDDPGNPANPGHLVIDVELPDGATPERAAQTLSRAVEVSRQAPGVKDVLALIEHPFTSNRNRPCLVAGLASGNERTGVAETVRARLREQIPEAAFRLSVPSAPDGFPAYGFPVDFTIEDLGRHGGEALRERAGALAEAMTRSGKFTDASLGAGQGREPFLRLEIDRAKCAALGVNIDDLLKTVQTFLGAQDGSSFNQFGRTWLIDLRLDPRIRGQAADIQKLQVKNDRGQAVPLGTVVTAREVTGPTVIERHNLCPAARLTANLSAGVSPAEAKSLCETLAAKELDPKEFRMIWRTR